MSIINTELVNRLFRHNLVDSGSAGSLMEGSISPLNLTILNSLGSNVLIQRTKHGIELQDKNLEKRLDRVVLNEQNQLKFDTFHDFIDNFIENNSKEHMHSCIRIQAQETVMRPFKLIHRIFTGNPIFKESNFLTISNCIEFSMFAQLIATKYYPETSVRVITMSKTPLELKYILKGQLANPIADRHYIVLFKDPNNLEEKDYLYIFGQKIRETNSQIELLKRKTRDDAKQTRFVENLEKRINKERKKL